ncbi:hypothetical protein OCK74_22235 [Chitinophagaceae bacterium LB-8]|uniref:Uncharacterized protein n=1 Tax=Paraflavisolibacter caeni TaxID=2982496 RepID=A0A9X3B998_9BACT|nr:hypothetical protein [Paraflavisolibacter caeni]MCU7551855.1 hypothetical protein [Paraflavisolibacter caeni]
MKFRKVIISFIVFFFFVAAAKAQPVYESVKELAQRRVPWLAEKILFSSIPKENGRDVFILQTKITGLLYLRREQMQPPKGLDIILKIIAIDPCRTWETILRLL